MLKRRAGVTDAQRPRSRTYSEIRIQNHNTVTHFNTLCGAQRGSFRLYEMLL